MLETKEVPQPANLTMLTYALILVIKFIDGFNRQTISHKIPIINFDRFGIFSDQHKELLPIQV